ncbi:MAG: MBL fold metallo-hydrolase [Lentisphaerae bacterium]|jgi:metallo-beta-lactamase family protein|nr:MBL fold metallo-hydrolase [Lentisphaerota bacterium]
MKFTVGFYGATGNVTGSCYCLCANQKNILIDCGLYQERNLKDRNWAKFPIPPKKIDAVVLTHAHLDHCGLLPKLVREGFRGPIYCTAPTAEIAKIVLLDSARINEEDAEFKRRRHAREKRKSRFPVVPLYTEEDAKETLPLFKTWKFATPLELGEGLSVEFIEVAHILGAASVRFTITQDGEQRRLLFSGDVGRWDMPILRDPSPIGEADYVIVESTYGNRIHGSQEDIPSQLANIINETRAAGGNIIIPSFAIERAQELLYFLSVLLKEDKIPHLRIFLDSPMAVKVSMVFKRFPQFFDQETTKLQHTFRASNISLVHSVADSKSINHIRGSVIVIAGSGMCTGGRIKHHLTHNIERPESTVLFVGYQANGTLGRIILDGEKRVRILGEMYDVQARIERIFGFSAHADQAELLRWLSSISNTPRKVFVTHGEPDAAKTFAEVLRAEKNWDVEIPQYKDQVILD